MKNKTIYIKRRLILACTLLICSASFAQLNDGVSISGNNQPPDEKAMFHVYEPSSGSMKGIIIPRMTYNQMIAISPATTTVTSNGLMVYVTDPSYLGYWFWDINNPTANQQWERLGADALWRKNSNKIYFKNDDPLVLDDFVGIGTDDPIRPLHIYSEEGYIRLTSYDPDPEMDFEYCGDNKLVGIEFDVEGMRPCAMEPPFEDMMGYLEFEPPAISDEGGAPVCCDGGFYFSHNIKANGFWLTSDSTLKKNRVELKTQTNPLLNVKTYSFNYKKASKSHRNHYGIMAQDLEVSFPDLVSRDKDGNKIVNYMELVPLLLDLTQKQQDKIDDLERRMIALEKKSK